MPSPKSRDSLIVESVVEILTGWECDIAEARDFLANALTDYAEEYERRAEEQWLERQTFDNALGSRCDAQARAEEARRLK